MRGFLNGTIDSVRMFLFTMLVLLNMGYIPIGTRNAANAGWGTCRLNPSSGYGGYCPTTCPVFIIPGIKMDDCDSILPPGSNYGNCSGWCGSCSEMDKCEGTRRKSGRTCFCAYGC